MTPKSQPQWIEVTSRHNLTAYQLDSAFVGDRLEITVSSPPPTTAAWLTLYVLDPFITLEMVIGLSRLFGSFSSGQMPPALVVGVGYPTLDPAQVMTLRVRDLTPLGKDFLRAFSFQLAEKVIEVRRKGHFPVVLGGDCSILIGCMLALRRLGQYGLFFIDGHADFYQPEAEPNGEVASMELALVSGRGPAVLTDFAGLKPLVQDKAIVAFGYRDQEEQQQHGSQDIGETAIHTFDLAQVRDMGSARAVQQALKRLQKSQLDGLWIHLDADVLDDAMMPAVDYRLPGGLRWAEVSGVLRTLIASGQAVGITITIFNPKLDPDGSIARAFTQSIIAGLTQADPKE